MAICAQGLDETPALIQNRDAHAWNILLPRDPGKGRVYLLAWQTYPPWISAQDLVYHITLFWYPELRRLMETALLDRYYQSPGGACGVEDFTRDALLIDYRLSVMRCLYVPAIHGGNLDTAWLWWPQLQNVMAAFEDLDCAELHK